jgi:hypothetical protein
MSRHTRIVPIAAILVAGVVFGAVPSPADQSSAAAGAPSGVAPSLAGRWKLNVEKSDDVGKLMREARDGRSGGLPPGGPGGGMGGPPGGGMGGRGGGGMGGPPGGGMGGRGGPGGDPRESMRAVFEAPSELLVTPTENEVAILEKDGRMRTLHPDGKRYKSEAGARETKTRWEGARLVVETKASNGVKIIETFAIGPLPQDEAKAAAAKAGNEAAPDPAADAKLVGRRTMTVTVRLEGSPMPPMTLKRVYDSVPSSAE